MLDETAARILSVLQTDGRITNLDLASRVNLSPAPCLRRVRTMEDEGIIRQYVALVDPRKVGLNLEVNVDVRLKAHTKAVTEAFERRVQSIPEILECSLVAGEWDYSLRVVIASLDEYRNFQMNRLKAENSEIAAFRSTIIISKIKHTTQLPLAQ